MKVPGSNLLNAALGVIASQTLGYYAFVKRTTNKIGYDVDTYALPLAVRGSIQAVSRSMMVDQGLDLQKNYVNIFISRQVLDLNRDVSSDYFIYGPVSKPGPFQLGTHGGEGITTDSMQQIITGAPANAAVYKGLSATKWFAQDGWVQVLCVEVPKYPTGS